LKFLARKAAVLVEAKASTYRYFRPS